MKETCTGGKKEFVIAFFIAAALYFVSEYIKYILPAYKAIGIVVQILLFCILVYFVMTRYSAVYTYELDKSFLRITRKIGHREKQLEIKCRDMNSLTKTPPKGVKIYNMKKTIFSHKSEVYLAFGEYAVCFMPSREMIEKVKKMINKKG